MVALSRRGYDLQRACVSCVLARLHLLDLLTERGTVTGTVLSGDADLLCAFRHVGGVV